MEHRGVIITAGFDKSKVAVAIAELLKRRGIPVKGFIVVSPYSLKRLRTALRRRGVSFVVDGAYRLLGFNHSKQGRKDDYLDTFLLQKKIETNSVKKWCKTNSAKYRSVSSLNSKEAVGLLKEENPQWLVYSGGGIVNEEIINTMNGAILNAHQGPLPETRGMNAAEWSILLDERQETTIHLIDKGIDTGQIIKTIPYSIQHGDSITGIREKAIIKGIEGLAEVAAQRNLSNFDVRKNHSNHRQCYVLSSAMKELLELKLRLLQEKISR